jgi:hypothetical protein
MKKIIFNVVRQLLVVLTVMSMVLGLMAYTAYADDEVTSKAEGNEAAEGTGVDAGGASTEGQTATGKNQSIFILPSASRYGNVPAPTQSTAQGQFQELMWGVVQNVRFILGAVAIAFIVYAGFRMVTAWGNEEVYTKQRMTILYAIVGLAVVGLSGEFARIFAVSCPPEGTQIAGQTQAGCTQGGFLKDPNAIIRSSTLFNQQTKLIITFIKYFLGGVAVLMMVRSGLRMVTMGSQEEKMAQDKKNLLYGGLGLLIVVIADTVVNQVFYKIDMTQYPSTSGAAPGIDAARGVQEIVGVTNFIVSIVGPIAVLMLLAGGIMYISAAGKEETMNKAKRLIVVALVGILIIYGAFAIVSTFIAGNFGEPPPAAASAVTAAIASVYPI